MTNISAQSVNQHSAYYVLQKSSNSFVFTTDYNVTLEVGFVEDNTLEIEGIYQFFILNVSSKNGYPPKDIKIKQTIFAIFEEFFKQNSLAVLYVCDIADGRQEIRDRLFRMWFNDYAANSSYHLEHTSITVEEITYYASLLTRLDNPNLHSLLAAFRSLSSDLKMKIE